MRYVEVTTPKLLASRCGSRDASWCSAIGTRAANFLDRFLDWNMDDAAELADILFDTLIVIGPCAHVRRPTFPAGPGRASSNHRLPFTLHHVRRRRYRFSHAAAPVCRWRGPGDLFRHLWSGRACRDRHCSHMGLAISAPNCATRHPRNSPTLPTRGTAPTAQRHREQNATYNGGSIVRVVRLAQAHKIPMRLVSGRQNRARLVVRRSLLTS